MSEIMDRLDALKGKIPKGEYDFFDGQVQLCKNKREGYTPAMRELSKGAMGKYVVELINGHEAIKAEIERLEGIIAGAKLDLYCVGTGRPLCMFCKLVGTAGCKNAPSRECFVWGRDT